MNAGPVDGWHKCQTSLRSKAAALASVTLYLDELAEFLVYNFTAFLFSLWTVTVPLRMSRNYAT
jgi:hypothetical protein